MLVTYDKFSLDFSSDIDYNRDNMSRGEQVMTQEMKDRMMETVRDFRLPRYDEIPNVGLYLEQVTKYIRDCLAPLEAVNITSSMISNYVKRGLVENPVKKQYNRNQIAYLIYIAVAKTVLSLDNIRILFDMQEETYDTKTAYDYFCTELENMIFYVFGLKDSLGTEDSEVTDEKMMLRNTIITVAYQTYQNMCFSALQSEQGLKKG